MKILQINTHKSSGAIPKIANSIAKYSDYNHFIYSPYGGRSITDKVNNFYRYMYALKARLLDCDGFIYSTFNKQIEKLIIENNFNIVHVHNPHGYYLQFSQLIDFCNKRNIPIIWTLHDYWALSGRCASPAAFACHAYKEGCEKCNFPQNYPKTWISRSRQNFLEKRSNFFNQIIFPVCVSRYQKSVMDFNLVFKNQIRLIENGIEHGSEVKSNINRYTNGKKIRLGFIANSWTEAKGLVDLEIFIKMASNYLEKVELVIVGLENSKSKLNSPSNIIYLGKLNDISELNDFYSSIDICVNLSNIDTFGMINIEALSNMVPVLAKPIEPYLSLFSEVDVVQFMEPTLSLSSIFDQSSKLLSWCEEHRQIAKQQFEKIRGKYSSARMSAEYDKLYNYALENLGRRQRYESLDV